MPLDTDTDSLNAAAFSQHSDDVFGRIATRYDMLCDLFSLGIHRIWKREVARQIAKERWSTLLGGATGTGHILLRVLQHGVSGERTIVGSDIVLEASNIPWRPLHAAYLAYMSLCMPWRSGRRVKQTDSVRLTS